jgi:hypothetical protein
MVILSQYKADGFNAILCKGYHPQYNPTGDYKIAKTPVSTGFTSEAYVPPSEEECQKWLAEGGWLGFLVPPGVLVLDVEDQDAIDQIEIIIMEQRLTVGVHKSRNGKHYFFRADTYSANSQMLVKSGLKVTYRVAGKNYLILAPSDHPHRKWITYVSPGNCSQLPDSLTPLNKHDQDQDQVLSALATQVAYYYAAGKLSGYEDIDLAYMGYLYQLGLPEEPVLQFFKQVYGPCFDEGRTRTLYHRVSTQENILGAGTFIQVAKDKNLTTITDLIDILSRSKKKEATGSLFDYALTEGDLEIPDSWLIKDMLAPYTITLFYGEAGGGKSLLAISLAMYNLQNQLVDGVIYLDGDNSKTALKRRKFEKIIKAFPAEKFIYIPSFKADSSLFQTLRAHIDQNRDLHYLVVIDSIRNFMVGKDVNTDRDSGDFMRLVQDLRNTDNTVMLLHHLNKKGGMKNSTTFKDYSDTAYKVESHNDKDAGLLTIGLLNEKDRIGVKDKLTCYIRYADYYIRIVPGIIAPEDHVVIEAIRAALSKDSMNQKSIKAAIKGDNNRLQRVLDEYSGKIWVYTIGPNNSKIYTLNNNNNNDIIEWKMKFRKPADNQIAHYSSATPVKIAKKPADNPMNTGVSVNTPASRGYLGLSACKNAVSPMDTGLSGYLPTSRTSICGDIKKG